MTASQDDEIRRLRAALRHAHAEAGELHAEIQRLEKEQRIMQRKLDGAWEQLSDIRHSTSWHLTAPVRHVKSAVRMRLPR